LPPHKMLCVWKFLAAFISPLHRRWMHYVHFAMHPALVCNVTTHRRTGRHFTWGAEKICPENNNLP